MQRGWTDNNFREKAFAHPRLFFVAIGLCSSVAQVYGKGLIETYPIFQTLSVSKAIVASDTDCPQPLTVTTFLHKQICVHPCLAEKLTAANILLEQQGFSQASQLGVQRLTGFRQGQTSLHGLGMAIDIDAAANLYLIHERNETKLDEELATVYERIAQFMLGRASIIPHLGEGCQAKEMRRTYIARLYHTLAQESAAMQRYFVLMQDGPRLRDYVHTSLGSQRARLASTFLSTLSREDENPPRTRDNAAPTALSNMLIDRIRLRMMSDWMILRGQAGPAIPALSEADTARPGANVHLPYPPEVSPDSDDPTKGEADRPFAAKGNAYPGRSPLNGFLTLREELVLALIDAGLRWGAADFGRTSGDLMHFDSRDTACKGSGDGK